METSFVMECVEEELEPVQHEDELEDDDDDDDEFNPAFLPVQMLPSGSREQTEQRRTKLSAMDAFEVALSEEVRKHKHLYNGSLKNHKDFWAVNSSWTEIAETLSADATYCKKRWQNLRDKFTKARRRLMTSGRRYPGGRNRVPALYTVLGWLDCHIKDKPRKPKKSMKIFISQAEQEPISRSPSTDLELELSTVNTDEFDCCVLDPPTSPPEPSPVPTPAPSIPNPAPRPPPTTPLRPPPTPPTPTTSSRPVPSPLAVPSLSPTVPASGPGPSTTSCPVPYTTSCFAAMDAFEVALSEEVRKHKHLYNGSLKNHKDSWAVNSSWTEIAETLSADATYCRKRWQNIRDKFTKARRRMMMTWGRRPGGRRRVPVLYTVLRWLDCHIKPKPSMKMFISQAELKQEQPSPSCQPISRSPSTDIVELALSTVNTDEFDVCVLDPPTSPPALSSVTAPSIPIPAPCPPPTPLRPPPTPTPTASFHPVPSPLPVPSLSPTYVPASCPGPSAPSCPGPSAGGTAPLRSRKRKRTSEPEGLDYQSLFAALDQRRAEREAAMEAGRERRTAVIERLLEQQQQPQDECDRYVLHVADFMRSLPSDHLSEFRFRLQNLMRETEQEVKNEVVMENGFTAVKGNGHQNGEQR